MIVRAGRFDRRPQGSNYSSVVVVHRRAALGWYVSFHTQSSCRLLIISHRFRRSLLDVALRQNGKWYRDEPADEDGSGCDQPREACSEPLRESILLSALYSLLTGRGDMVVFDVEPRRRVDVH